MTDPRRDLVSDVDLAVWADRRSDVPLGVGPELLLEGEAHRVAEDLAARDRSRLEALLAADDERIDVSVVDSWSETASAVPSGATEIMLFPNLAPAAGWADGCFQGIRNPAAHEDGLNLPEQIALEQLAAFSVLARWIDECTVEKVPAS